MTRVRNAQNQIKKKNLSSLITSDPHFLYYFTGIHFTSGTLILTPKEAHLFVDGRYVMEASPLKPRFFVHEFSSKQELPQIIQEKISSLSGTMAFCPIKTTYEGFCRLQTIAQAINELMLVPDEELFSNLRRCKDADEQSKIKKAVQLTDQVIKEAFQQCKKGITEKELASFIKIRFLQEGAGIAFDPIVAFGKNSACPHWTPSETPLVDQEVILIDCGAQWQGYDGDMTRTMWHKKPSQALENAHAAVLRAYESAYRIARPGTSVVDMYSAAVEALREAGLDQFFKHGLGHGVGLEIHEAPSLKKTSENVFLEKGDVITIEPGVYLPDIGGIRYENTLLVHDHGLEGFLS